MRDGWRQTTLGEVARTVPPSKTAAGVRYVGLEHIDSGNPRIVRWGNTDEVLSASTEFVAGDVLFSKLRPYLRKVAVADFAGRCTNEALVYRSTDSVLLQSYLGLVLQSEAAVNHADASSVGSRMPRTSSKIMAGFAFPLPPLVEQRRIVDLIAALDDTIHTAEESGERARRNLDQMRSYLLNSVSYSRSTIPDIAHLINGHPFKPGDLGDTGLPVLRIKQLMDAEAPMDRSCLDIPEQRKIDSGDLIFSWSGTIDAVIWDRGPALLNQHLFRVIPRGPVQDRRLLKHIIKATIPDLHLHGTTMKHVTKSELNRHEIPVPPVEEQRELTETLEGLEEIVLGLSTQAKSLYALRTNLLTALLSGEHEIPASYDDLIDTHLEAA